MLKNDTFLALILKGFGPHFRRVFGRFFGTKIHQNSENMILAKILKLVIFLWENNDFQEIKDRKKEKHRAKIDEKSHAFGDFDFKWISCAAHRPPHQKERKQSAGQCKCVVTAQLAALCAKVRALCQECCAEGAGMCRERRCNHRRQEV